jgi:Protein of unknown function, DUF547
MRAMRPLSILLAIVPAMLLGAAPRAFNFDHEYTDYAKVLHDHLRGDRVDYAALKHGRAALDSVVAQFAEPGLDEEPRWSRDQQLAFWINAYNLFTLRAIVDHYPIRSATFTLQPRNSIRQIDGVWTTLTWKAAGRVVTLDDIEHRILRPEFKEPRVHFAINCASVGCPPLAVDPYRPATLDAQLDEAAHRYLASDRGLRIEGTMLRVTKILEWYGEDFVSRFAPDAVGASDRLERAIRGVVARFGPPVAADLARQPSTKIRFLDYDWSLNEVK